HDHLAPAPAPAGPAAGPRRATPRSAHRRAAVLDALAGRLGAAERGDVHFRQPRLGCPLHLARAVLDEHELVPRRGPAPAWAPRARRRALGAVARARRARRL